MYEPSGKITSGRCIDEEIDEDDDDDDDGDCDCAVAVDDDVDGGVDDGEDFVDDENIEMMRVAVELLCC